MSTRNITLKHLLIDQKRKIGLQFYPDHVIQNLVKTLPNVRWSNEFKMVYIDNTKENLTLVFKTFAGIAWINGRYFFKDKKRHNNPELKVVTKKKPNLPECPKEYIKQLEINKYAASTAKTYIRFFQVFMKRFAHKKLLEINELDITDYLQELVHLGKSDSYVNQMINAIKFYYEGVLGMPNRFYSVHRPNKKEELPKVISTGEVKAILQQIHNIKHLCIVQLLYSAGLRRNELLALKVEDIDGKRNLIRVRHGKGGKDRMTILSPVVLENLRKYYRIYKPQNYLFEGARGGRYSATSVCKIIKRAAQKAKVKQTVSPHILRHSFATHLIENRVDIRHIQVLMGHKSTKTTEIYTHVANTLVSTIKSPLDAL